MCQLKQSWGGSDMFLARMTVTFGYYLVFYLLQVPIFKDEYWILVITPSRVSKTLDKK